LRTTTPTAPTQRLVWSRRSIGQSDRHQRGSAPCAPAGSARRAAPRVPPTSCMNEFLHPTGCSRRTLAHRLGPLALLAAELSRSGWGAWWHTPTQQLASHSQRIAVRAKGTCRHVFGATLDSTRVPFAALGSGDASQYRAPHLHADAQLTDHVRVSAPNAFVGVCDLGAPGAGARRRPR